jgi:hypothetical protein
VNNCLMLVMLEACLFALQYNGLPTQIETVQDEAIAGINFGRDNAHLRLRCYHNQKPRQV